MFLSRTIQSHTQRVGGVNSLHLCCIVESLLVNNLKFHFSFNFRQIKWWKTFSNNVTHFSLKLDRWRNAVSKKIEILLIWRTRHKRSTEPMHVHCLLDISISVIIFLFCFCTKTHQGFIQLQNVMGYVSVGCRCSHRWRIMATENQQESWMDFGHLSFQMWKCFCINHWTRMPNATSFWNDFEIYLF